jgi:hypothetical protein
LGIRQFEEGKREKDKGKRMRKKKYFSPYSPCLPCSPPPLLF